LFGCGVTCHSNWATHHLKTNFMNNEYDVGIRQIGKLETQKKKIEKILGDGQKGVAE